MLKDNNTKLRKNFDVCENKMKLIEAFLQGAVYCWIKNKKDEVFAVSDLMGGENFYWNETPLICLYEHEKSKGKDNESAIKEAGIILGWILKNVLQKDKRTFETYNKGMAKGYKWVGNEA